jgi:MFS family permease
MQSFIIIWVGQLVSIVGSGLTSFALGVWVYQQTGSVTQLALVTLCYQIGLVVASFLAGPLIDRWNRRLVMIFSDCGASLCTLTVALLFFTNRLEMWNLYLCVAGNAAFSAVQWPAYSGAISLLVPQHHLGRANGLVQLGRAIAEVVSPVLAGVLIGLVRLQGVILIDYTTFLFALATLLVVRIPTPGKAGGGETVKDPSPRGMLYGWTFIAAHPGMLALLIYMAVIGFNYGIAQILIVPLVLGFASPATLGIMLSMGSGGLLAGGIVMSVWGGPDDASMELLALGCC